MTVCRAILQVAAQFLQGIGDLPFIKDLCTVIVDYVQPLINTLKGINVDLICIILPETCEFKDVLAGIIAFFTDNSSALEKLVQSLCQ